MCIDRVLGWRNIMVDNHGVRETHMVPVSDIRPHRLGAMCACRPLEDSECPDLWAHHAFDNRESYEQGRRTH